MTRRPLKPVSTDPATSQDRTPAASPPVPPTQGRSELAMPSFSLDDLEARRAWLWMLTFNIFQNRAAILDKPDTRFAMHLSELVGLAPAQVEGRPGHGDGLGEFLDGLSVEAFAEYKQQARPV